MAAKPAGNRLQFVPDVDRKTTQIQRPTTASTTLIALTAVAVIWHRQKRVPNVAPAAGDYSGEIRM
jgi:hypothetical protein